MDNAHVARRVARLPVRRRATFALVGFVANKGDAAILLGQTAKHVAGTVFAAVVHDDDFQFADQRMLEREHAANAGLHYVALVVDGDEYA